MKYMIAADSSADLGALGGTYEKSERFNPELLHGACYGIAPLKITAGENEYTDDDSLDVDAMTESLAAHHGRSRTACPSPADWENAFGDAEQVFCLPISSALSGSYNSALNAARDYEEKHAGRRVRVVDTLLAGPSLMPLAEKLGEMMAAGTDFDEMCAGIDEYKKSVNLIFMLSSMKNLANNGRVNPLIAKAAGLLGIRIIGKASEKGDLDVFEKSRGEAKSVTCIFESMKRLGYSGGSVRIGQIMNPSSASDLRGKILSEFPEADVLIYRSRGLCSYYAERGGLMIGF